jgi:hypothetical protein
MPDNDIEIELNNLFGQLRSLLESTNKPSQSIKNCLQYLCRAVKASWVRLYEFSSPHTVIQIGSYPITSTIDPGLQILNSPRTVKLNDSNELSIVLESIWYGRNLRLEREESQTLLKGFHCPDPKTVTLHVRLIPIGKPEYDDVMDPLGMILVAWDSELIGITPREEDMLKNAYLAACSILHTILERKRFESAFTEYSEFQWLISVTRAQKLLKNKRYSDFAVSMRTAFDRSINGEDCRLLCMSLQTLNRILKEPCWGKEIKDQENLGSSYPYALRLIEKLRSQLKEYVDTLNQKIKCLVLTDSESIEKRKGVDAANLHTIFHYSQQCDIGLLSELENLAKGDAWGKFDSPPESLATVSAEDIHKFSEIIGDYREALLQINAACLDTRVTDGTLSYELYCQLQGESSSA